LSHMVSLFFYAVLLGPLLTLGSRGSKRASAFLDGVFLSVVLGFTVLFLVPRALDDVGLLGMLGMVLGYLVASVLQRPTLAASTTSGIITALLALFLASGSWGASAEPSTLIFGLGVPITVGFTLSHFVLPRGGRVGTLVAALALTVAALLGTWATPIVNTAIGSDTRPLLNTFIAGLMIRCLLTRPAADRRSENGHSHGHAHSHHQEAHAQCHGHAHAHASHESEASHGHAHAHASHENEASHGHAHSHHQEAPDHSHGHAHASHESEAAHGHSHGHAHAAPPGGKPAMRATALGALSVSLVFFYYFVVTRGEGEQTMGIALNTFGVLALESAPALVIGYALSGLVPQVLTGESVARLAQGSRFGQACRGVVFGLPLPVCSCGVLPIYESLARRGVPLAAGLAFFVATPELGLDAVLLSVPMLGAPLTVARVVAAGAVALLVGILVGKVPAKRPVFDDDGEKDPSTEPWGVRVTKGLKFGFVDMFDHTMPWIALGLLLASIAEPLLSHESLSSLPPSVQVPISALVGVPLYVCASGATPLVAMSLHKGLSSGAALAFLIAGPATNVTTFGVLSRLHGRRLALVFGLTVTGLAMVAGWIVDASGVLAEPIVAAHAEPEGTPWQWACLSFLGALALASLFRQGPRGVLGQILEPIHAH